MMIQTLMLPPMKHFGSGVFGLSNIIPRCTMTSTTTMMYNAPWYHDPDLERDRSRVCDNPVEAATHENARYVVIRDQVGMYHTRRNNNSSSNNNNNTEEKKSSSSAGAEPLYLSYTQIESLLREEEEDNNDDRSRVLNMIQAQEEEKADNNNNKNLLAWIGHKGNADYWVLCLSEATALDSSSSSDVVSACALQPPDDDRTIEVAPLRKFGDLLDSVHDAGILATANGLVEFHNNHPFCHRCGSSTQVRKLGAHRKCPGCNNAVYPRIDVASIMLVTSPCDQYALLGRNKRWPEGFYSTLAGFTEVGETIEQSCIREVSEESGVEVDPASVRFVCSQPWPFPRSLMVGFRARAAAAAAPTSTAAAAAEDSSSPAVLLPTIDTSNDELEDAQWFHKSYVAERLRRGYYSNSKNEESSEFRIPGRAILARLLIEQWATSPS